MNGNSFPTVESRIKSDAVAPANVPRMHQAATATPAPRTAKQKKSRRRKQIIYGAIGLIVLWIVVSIILSKREKPIPVTTDKATKRTIVQIVSATGKIQPETEVKISPEVAGEIIDLPVDDGKQVKKGDLLVRINPDSYKALLGEGDEPATESDDAESGTGFETGRRHVREEGDVDPGI